MIVPVKFGEFPPSGLEGDVVKRKLSTNDHNSSLSAYGSVEL